MLSKASSLQSSLLSSPLLSLFRSPLKVILIPGWSQARHSVYERDRPSQLSYQQKPEEWPGGQEVPGRTRGGNTEQRLSDSDIQ